MNPTSLILLLALFGAAVQAADRKPNLLIFYIDDMGYGQPGCYGGKLAPTPNIDRLAAEGVRCTQGYVSACICSPSRVGIMTGRYQARTGHDANANQRPETWLDIRETTTAQRLKAAGYTTGIVGKWHLGGGNYLPVYRGFDYSFGTFGNLGEGAGPEFYRGSEKAEPPPGTPVTSPIYRDEAMRFIESNRDKTFFLYLAFNAVHAPHVASDSWLKKFEHIENRHDRDYAALIGEADEAIGAVMAKLHDLKLDERTLIFCISDNGGAYTHAEMGGLRGHKWFVWEGGIRVPFIARWTGRIPAGKILAEPVIQLDVLPTALAAAGAEVKPEWKLDGVNILPLLEGKINTLAREALYWRFGVQFAVRQGDWKLVKASAAMHPMLVNLATDPGEQNDLAAQNPGKVKELTALWDKWNADNLPPRWVDRRWDGDEERKANKKENKKAAK